MNGPVNITSFEQWAVKRMRLIDNCGYSKERHGRTTPLMCSPSTEHECCVRCHEWAMEEGDGR